jgi:hypothetical protein
LVAHVDQSPFGTRAPGTLDRAVLAATHAIPSTWLGLWLALLVLIEDTRGYRRTNVFALAEARGYTAFAGRRHNVALRRG